MKKAFEKLCKIKLLIKALQNKIKLFKALQNKIKLFKALQNKMQRFNLI